ncbi:MAG: hypothetical protein IKS31_00150 [Clostridia bacterium]|nr:hypothetical protein [Clostridia bacterium]
MEYIIGAIIGSVATSVVIIALVLFDNALVLFENRRRLEKERAVKRDD